MAWPFRTRSAVRPPRPSPEQSESTSAPELVLLETELDPKLVVHHDPTGRIAEQTRAFRTNLRATNPRNEPRALLFTSAEAGAGKSVGVGNLGLSLAECEELNVCLVDADLRGAGLSDLFGVADASGLAEVLVHRMAPRRVLCPTEHENLSLLPAGNVGSRLNEALTSGHLPELIAWLKRRHQYVLIDSAPVLLFSDAGELAKVCDGVILTVNIGGTLRSEADRALSQLRSAGAQMLGSFVTGAESAGDSVYDLREYVDVEA